MGGMIGAWRSMSQDPSVLKQKVKPGTAKRTIAFALPYTGLLTVFLLVVIVDASITIVNPLLYRQIINNGILKGNAPLIIHSAIIVGCLGLFDGALGIAQTFLSSKISAEIVLSLRNRLFQHIQRMPLAFFTRTQTGALVSRLNTDVQGARTAFTDILSNVIGNLITVVLILGAMFVLSWRITLGAVVLLPIFVLPARFWGRKLQAITRETYDLAGNMNNLMVERFNVAGAMLAKLFGRPEEDARTFREKAARVSDISIKLAIYSRLFFTALAVVATVASALAYGWGRRPCRPSCSRRGHCRRAHRLSRSPLHTARRPLQRPSQHHDGAGLIREGLRSPRSSAHDPAERPGRAHRTRSRLHRV